MPKFIRVSMETPSLHIQEEPLLLPCGDHVTDDDLHPLRHALSAMYLDLLPPAITATLDTKIDVSVIELEGTN
jgi:hypothetical protein